MFQNYNKMLILSPLRKSNMSYFSNANIKFFYYIFISQFLKNKIHINTDEFDHWISKELLNFLLIISYHININLHRKTLSFLY